MVEVGLVQGALLGKLARFCGPAGPQPRSPEVFAPYLDQYVLCSIDGSHEVSVLCVLPVFRLVRHAACAAGGRAALEFRPRGARPARWGDECTISGTYFVVASLRLSPIAYLVAGNVLLVFYLRHAMVF